MLITLTTMLALTARPMHCPAALPPLEGPAPSWTLVLRVAPASSSGADRPSQEVPPETSAPPAAADEAAEALLERLEAGARDLTGFTARITYTKEDALLGRREIRTGELIYQVEPATGRKRFAALFDGIVIGQRKESRLKHFVFDGQWLAEIDHRNKQFIKRQVVPPGRQLDPLKLGEGPIPIPIGQPRQAVLERFEVRSLEPPVEGPLAGLAGDFHLNGLRLTPRAGTPMAEDVERVDLFYDQATGLPVGVLLLDVNGDRKIVRLAEPVRNPELTAAQEEKLRIETPDPKSWQISVEPWPKETSPGGGGAETNDRAPGA